MSTDNAVMEKLDAFDAGFEKWKEEHRQALNEMQEGFDGKLAELAETDESIRASIEEQAEKIRERGLSLPGFEDEKEQWSMSRVRRALATGKHEKYASFEFSVSRETAELNEQVLIERKVIGDGQDYIYRDMSTLLGSTGGFLVPEEQSNLFLPLLKDATVMDQLGVNRMTNLTGWPLRGNKMTGATTAYRHAEGQAVTESQVSLGRFSLTPKKMSAYSVLTDEDSRYTAPPLEQIVLRDHMEQIALRADLDFFEGGGGTSPVGVVNTTGVNKVQINSGTAAVLNHEHFVDLEKTLMDANALRGNLAYVTKPGVVQQLRKLRHDAVTANDSAGAFIIPPWVPINTALNHPMYTTNQLSQGTSGNVAADDANSTFLYFGNWADTIHAMWGGMLVRRSDQAYDGNHNMWTEHKLGVITTMWDDVAVPRPASIIYTADVKHSA